MTQLGSYSAVSSMAAEIREVLCSMRLKVILDDIDVLVVSLTNLFLKSDHIIELSKLKYAKFTVKSLLKYW